MDFFDLLLFVGIFIYEKIATKMTIEEPVSRVFKSKEFPLVIDYSEQQDWLLKLEEEKSSLRRLLLVHGALLFRGFNF
jgi:hypothetical protein